MGITYRIDRERNELRAIAEGTVTLADVRAHLLKEWNDLALPYRELIDARRAEIDLSPGEVRSITELLRDYSRSNRLGPTAVVVSAEVAYGMMRMLQMLVEDVCIVHPFRDLAEAEHWLAAWSRP